jgi:hypothetical protein
MFPLCNLANNYNQMNKLVLLISFIKFTIYRETAYNIQDIYCHFFSNKFH